MIFIFSVKDQRSRSQQLSAEPTMPLGVSEFPFLKVLFLRNLQLSWEWFLCIVWHTSVWIQLISILKEVTTRYASVPADWVPVRISMQSELARSQDWNPVRTGIQSELARSQDWYPVRTGTQSGLESSQDWATSLEWYLPNWYKFYWTIHTFLFSNTL